MLYSSFMKRCLPFLAVLLLCGCMSRTPPDTIYPDPVSSSSSSVRLALTNAELQNLLAAMHLKALTAPEDFGDIVKNVDWESETKEPGRKISIGFSDLYSPYFVWSKVFIEYSTYIFEAGTEYHTFATHEDFLAVEKNALGENRTPVTVNGVKGYIEDWIDPNWGGVYRLAVFPFETYYIAAVFETKHPWDGFTAQYGEDVVLQKALHDETLPESELKVLRSFTKLVQSFEFTDRQ